MNSPTSPRRFRFGLRTLFVVVTLIAVAMAWPLNWIRQRHEFLAAQKVAHSGPAFEGYESIGSDGNPDLVEWGAAPLVLRLFGEYGHSLVDVVVEAKHWQKLTEMDKQRITEARRLFPEATIYISHGHAGEQGAYEWWGDVAPD